MTAVDALLNFQFYFLCFYVEFLCCRRGGKGGLVGDGTSSVANVRTFLYIYILALLVGIKGYEKIE